MLPSFVVLSALDGSSIAGLEAFLPPASKRILAIPGAYDTLDPDAVAALIGTGFELRLLAVTPAGMSQRFHDAAIGVAASYELKRVAIPLHSQNLKDRIEREYGFGVANDRALLKMLRSMNGIAEVSENVFQARARARENWPRAVIKAWVELLRRNFASQVFDVAALSQALIEWYEPLSSHFHSPVQPIAATFGWIEKADAGTQTVYECAGQKARPRLVVQDAANYLSFSSLSELVSAETVPIDSFVLGQIQRSRSARERLVLANDAGARSKALVDYAKLWISYIKNQRTRGQEQKWRGWYLVPEHGPLTLEKLQELRRILVELERRSPGEPLIVGTDRKGVENAVALLRAGKVEYRGGFSATQKRNLFIRQQKNYLLRLGLVDEVSPNKLLITPIGKRWLEEGDSKLKENFYEALMGLRWVWCNMAYASFLEALIKDLDNYVTYRELHNWIVHVYELSQLAEIRTVVSTYRKLSTSARQETDRRIDKLLAEQLEEHLSDNALGHYRTKIKDLMIAFATTGHYRLRASASVDTWRLEFVTT